MDTDEARAVEAILGWISDRNPGNCSEQAQEDAALAAAMLLADRAGLAELSAHSIQKHWRTLIDVRDDHPDPHACGACVRLHDSCPYHRGVEGGIAYAANWISRHVKQSPITSSNVGAVTLAMLDDD